METTVGMGGRGLLPTPAKAARTYVSVYGSLGGMNRGRVRQQQTFVGQASAQDEH